MSNRKEPNEHQQAQPNDQSIAAFLADESLTPRQRAELQLLDSGVASVFGAENAPDVTSQVLARIKHAQGTSNLEALSTTQTALRTLPQSTESNATATRSNSHSHSHPKPRRPWLERGLVAAGVLGLIAASYFVIQPLVSNSSKRESQLTADGEDSRLPSGMAASPDTRWKAAKDGIELEEGWVWLDGASDSISIGKDRVSTSGARALVRVGGIPDPQELDAISHYLTTHTALKNGPTSEEQDMIRNPKIWTTAGALSICLVAGCASANGEDLESKPVASGLDYQVQDSAIPQASRANWKSSKSNKSAYADEESASDLNYLPDGRTTTEILKYYSDETNEFSRNRLNRVLKELAETEAQLVDTETKLASVKQDLAKDLENQALKSQCDTLQTQVETLRALTLDRKNEAKLAADVKREHELARIAEQVRESDYALHRNINKEAIELAKPMEEKVQALQDRLKGAELRLKLAEERAQAAEARAKILEEERAKQLAAEAAKPTPAPR